jgi:O-antigen ligase
MPLTSLAFIAAFGAGCLLALVRGPFIGLLLYVAVFYLSPPDRWWGAWLPDLRWSLLAAGVTAVAALMHLRTASRVPLFRHRFMTGLVVFIAWLVVQVLWALSRDLQINLLALFAKYALLLWLMYVVLDSERRVKLFLWVHVLGCGYLGWIAFERYVGGRFEGIGGPGIGEANALALQMVTGVFAAAALLLAGRWWQRGILIGVLPFIINTIVATVSRSAFLAAAVGGAIFSLITPIRYRKVVGVLAILGLVLFLLLTNPLFWSRMETLTMAGQEVEGVDTGQSRLVLIAAQWRMFKSRPAGCGHRCTAILSPSYLEAKYLSGQGRSAKAGRSSHNTLMTMLVEQGVPGLLFYVLGLYWLYRKIGVLWQRHRDQRGFFATLLPAVAGTLAAITVADMFVDYLKFEARIWFIGILLVMLNLSQERKSKSEAGTPDA